MVGRSIATATINRIHLHQGIPLRVPPLPARSRNQRQYRSRPFVRSTIWLRTIGGGLRFWRRWLGCCIGSGSCISGTRGMRMSSWFDSDLGPIPEGWGSRLPPRPANSIFAIQRQAASSMRTNCSTRTRSRPSTDRRLPSLELGARIKSEVLCIDDAAVMVSKSSTHGSAESQGAWIAMGLWNRAVLCSTVVHGLVANPVTMDRICSCTIFL